MKYSLLNRSNIRRTSEPFVPAPGSKERSRMYLSNHKGNQDQQDKMYSLLSLKPSGDFKKSTCYVMKLIKYLELQSMSKQGKEYSLLDLLLRYSLDQIRVSTRISV